MTAIVGTGSEGSGKLRCNIHEFETLDLNEWHDHCTNEEGHAIVGETLCQDCGQSVDLGDGIPYTKNLNVRCPDCFDNYVSAHNNFKSNLKLKESVQPTTQEPQPQPQDQEVSNYEAQGVDQ